MKLLSSEKADSPIEVSFYILVYVVVIALLMFISGAIIDTFLYQISIIPISLSSWGTGMMVHVNTWAAWLFWVPSILITIILVWGIKTIIRKKQYTAQDQQYLNYEENL